MPLCDREYSRKDGKLEKLDREDFKEFLKE